jgi:hypothetical protein
MPELLLVVAFIVGLFVIEAWYVKHHQMTISEHVQRLNDAMSKQLVAGIFFGLGAVAGWFVAHFTDTVIR